MLAAAGSTASRRSPRQDFWRPPRSNYEIYSSSVGELAVLGRVEGNSVGIRE